jgi:hypothetical protein
VRCSTRPNAALPAFLVGVATLLAGARASAYEHQWHLGGSLGYDALFAGGTSHGFGGGVHAAYGLNDSFNLMAEIDVTAHPYAQWVVTSGGIGAGYVLDVLQWVPYVGALVGGAGVFSTDPQCGVSISEPCKQFRLNLEIPFGVDYQLSRSFSIGLAGRFQVLLLGEFPWTSMGAFMRAEYTWGY